MCGIESTIEVGVSIEIHDGVYGRWKKELRQIQSTLERPGADKYDIALAVQGIKNLLEEMETA